MSSNNSKDDSSFFDGSSDQLDTMMGNIMQGSIAMAFRHLIEPTENNKVNSKTPPPLKLHDFGGSDFVRLAEKSRRNRSTALKSQEPALHGLDKPMASLSYGNGSSPSPSNGIDYISLVVENEKSLPNNDWKCTQECIFREDGSEETVYQKFHDGQATETLHHVLYPDGTIKNIKKPMIPSSSSTVSSLSSIADDATPNTGPFKRLWHLVFD